jgi:glycosyltransferase involved in cell wall biosynthesis
VVSAAHVLEWSFRALSRRVPVVVVGSDLEQRYGAAGSILSLYVSLLQESELLPAGEDSRRYDDDELMLLSVGRLDPEKNPLLLVDVLRRALQADPRWRLHVCGDGLLASALADRAAELDLSDRVIQHGHVPIDGGLWDFYRRAHALLHVSMTEGVPQVILEAFAARLPVVATAVGGVGDLVAGRGLLAAPCDPDAAAAALTRVVSEPDLRRRLVDAAQQMAAAHTRAAECGRLARFLSTGGERASRAWAARRRDSGGRDYVSV